VSRATEKLQELLFELDKHNRRREFLQTFSEAPIQVMQLMCAAQAKDILVRRETTDVAAAHSPPCDMPHGCEIQSLAVCVCVCVCVFLKLQTGVSGVDDELERRGEYYHADWLYDAVDKFLTEESNMAANAMASTQTFSQRG
jgi:hypothetical protein